MSVRKYYKQKKRAGEREVETALNNLTIEAAWNNRQDEKAAEFYAKKYLRALK